MHTKGIFLLLQIICAFTLKDQKNEANAFRKRSILLAFIILNHLRSFKRCRNAGNLYSSIDFRQCSLQKLRKLVAFWRDAKSIVNRTKSLSITKRNRAVSFERLNNMYCEEVAKLLFSF